MTANTTFSVRLPPETRRELEDYARTTRRSSAFVVKEAIEEHLARRRAYRAAVEEGLADISAGDTIAGEAIFTWMRSWGTADEHAAPDTGAPDRRP